MSMKPVLYRVETYIVPEANELPVETAIKEVDNIKTINRFKHKSISEKNVQNEDNMLPATYNKHMEFVKYSAENKLSNRKVMKDVTNEDQTLAIEQEFHNDNERYNKDDLYSNKRLNVQNKKFCASVESQESLYPVRQFKRFNSLVSIDEGSEVSLETKLNFCHHGYKNGCTATIPPPEEVSEEIFKENWLQKIELLRQQETLLREKEMNLQSRERELFRKEKELRIAERALKDKIKQVEQRELQCQKNMQIVEKRLSKAARILSDELKESDDPAKAERLRNSQPLVSSCEKIDKREESDLIRDKKLKHLTRSKSHLSKHPSSSNVTSASHTYASIKHKERPKICYDDLNSTLSADPGDSSFVRTSERFNPEFYKKPSAFTRSASERWTKQKDRIVPKRSILDSVEKLEHIEEEKVFKKLSENICASQDKDTKFQNYGLVDCRLNDVQSKIERNLGKEGKFSYLDLEINNTHSQRVTNVSKDRPISWNEEENKWLQKKREAFNLATKKSENKENLKCNTITEKSGKTSKKGCKEQIIHYISLTDIRPYCY